MKTFIDHFEETTIIGVLRNIDKSEIMPLLSASYDAGIRVMEITLNTNEGTKLISEAANVFGGKLSIGAGTVLNIADAEKAISAGATFVVGPNCDDKIAELCKIKNIAYIPGALTPTEIAHAWEASRHGIVKVFPANVFGPGYIKSLIHGPYNGMKLLVTGGVLLEDIREYMVAGASGVAIGAGTVYKKEWIEAKNWGAITGLLKQYITAIKYS
ncbi:MAG TPA: bifunctional 4-hydroxy-2-oxoglutarate aldolase/2-dehydro-3-deoxy-phosphogluconate aldolase [Candidatus Saccharimonadales bacterium]|nr:bifunctional 4-hydroxy-2-oxoglutarate aldolase/2-dehydro-3-deoxy-phosphogluconate aldolase [Candidatus Saccharimonadales bacterium]